MPETAARRAWIRAGVAALCLAYAVVALTQAAKLDFDFEHFYLDAAYVWHHGDLPPLEGPSARRLPFYLPGVSLLLAPLAAAGPGVAAGLWTLAQAAALAYCLFTFAAWSDRDGRRLFSTAAVALAGALSLPALYEAARFNQLSVPVLAMILAGVVAIRRGQAVAGGAWLGAATFLKLLPGLFFVWLLLKRQWRAALALLLAVTTLDLTPSLIVLGPQGALERHRQWFSHNLRGAPAGGMTDPKLREHFIDHRNQSLGAVVARLAWREHPHRVAVPLADWPLGACRIVAACIAGGVLATLCFATRRPLARLSELEIFRELSLYALAMIVLSPLLRQYYLVWAAPALLTLAAAVMRRSVLAGAALLVWVAGMLAWMWPAARLYGATLLTLLMIGAALLCLGRRRRSSTGDVPAGR